MDIIRKVKDAVDRHGLLSPGDSVLIGLSGGPDSVALLHLLSRLRKDYGLNLKAVYINHRIRPRAVKQEEKFCREICDRLGVSFESIDVNVPQLSRRNKIGLEETARNIRYEHLGRLAKELNCNRIALGHHADDQVETVLFRILRGTGRSGLCGIPVKRGGIIRPLINSTKKEILQYLKARKISYCVDKSNTGIDYTRNFIRNRLLPQIRKKINSNVDGAVLNLVDTLGEEENYLESIVDDAWDRCVSRTGGNKLVLALKRFRGYSLWEQRRLVRRCISVASNSVTAPDRKVVDRVLTVAEADRAVSLSGGIVCRKADDSLFFYKKRRVNFSKKLRLDGKTSVGSAGLTITSSVEAVKREVIARIRRSSNVIVDFDKVSPPLSVRSIRNGDRFRPLGLKGTKKIGDYLTDRKVNAIIRDEIPVVTDAAGIIWLVGYEIAERVKIENKTKRILKLECHAD